MSGFLAPRRLKRNLHETVCRQNSLKQFVDKLTSRIFVSGFFVKLAGNDQYLIPPSDLMLRPVGGVHSSTKALAKIVILMLDHIFQEDTA